MAITSQGYWEGEKVFGEFATWCVFRESRDGPSGESVHRGANAQAFNLAVREPTQRYVIGNPYMRGLPKGRPDGQMMSDFLCDSSRVMWPGNGFIDQAS